MKRSIVATAVGLLFGSIFDLRVKSEVVHFLDPVGVRTIHLGASMLSASNTLGVALNSSAGALLQNISVANASAADVLPSAFNSSSASTGDVYLPPLPLPSSSLQVHLPFGEHRLISVGDIGYILAVFWCLHLIGLLFFYDVPKRSALEEPIKHESHALLEQAIEDDEDMDTFADSDDNISTLGEETLDGTFEKLQTMSRRSVNYDSKHSYAESINNVWRLVLSNIAFPTTAAVLFLAKATAEVFLCSGATILNRYFAWSGALSGLFMGAVASVVLPINIHLSEETNLVERKTIKVGSSCISSCSILLSTKHIYYV